MAILRLLTSRKAAYTMIFGLWMCVVFSLFFVLEMQKPDTKRPRGKIKTTLEDSKPFVLTQFPTTAKGYIFQDIQQIIRTFMQDRKIIKNKEVEIVSCSVCRQFDAYLQVSASWYPECLDDCDD